MEVVPATCESDIPLMNVSVMDDTTDGEYWSCSIGGEGEGVREEDHFFLSM